jgi:hypothetical protein
MLRYREAARYVVELRWHAPRTWGARNLPHGGRFYAWALFESPTRRVWTHVDATGVFGPGGVETAELAIVTAENDPNVPDVHAGEQFELSRSGVAGIGNAAQGRIVRRVPESN